MRRLFSSSFLWDLHGKILPSKQALGFIFCCHPAVASPTPGSPALLGYPRRSRSHQMFFSYPLVSPNTWGLSASVGDRRHSQPAAGFILMHSIQLKAPQEPQIPPFLGGDKGENKHVAAASAALWKDAQQWTIDFW